MEAEAVDFSRFRFHRKSTASTFSASSFRFRFQIPAFDAVLQDFSDRFQEFEKISKTLRLVAFPHLVETESAPMDLQMELAQIKNDEQLVQKFKDEENSLETWKSAIKYPLLRELARETLTLSGSIDLCKSAFSKIKYLKNGYRTRLLDSNLESELRLMVSDETPDFASLSARMQTKGVINV